MLSLFPALLFAASLAGLAGGAGLVQDAVDAAAGAGLDADTQQVVRDAVRTALESSEGALGLALLLSLLLALSGASGALNAVGRSLDAVSGSQKADDARGFVVRRAQALALTAALALLALIGIAAMLLGGDFARDVFGEIGLGGAAASAWEFARWPLALIAAALSVSLVYRWAPSPDVRSTRFLSPGALAAVALWVVLTAGFTFYLRSFSDYGAVYGTFAGAVVLLLWLNLMATAFLFGAELDAELERRGASSAD